MEECPINKFSYKLEVYKTNSLLRLGELGLAVQPQEGVQRGGQRGSVLSEAEAPPRARTRFVSTHSAMDSTWLWGDWGLALMCMRNAS